MGMLGSRVHRLLRMDWWFPHVPLALAVGFSGLVQLLPSFGSLRHLIAFLALPTSELSGLSDGFSTLAIHGVSQELIGGLLVILSLGLLWRSRLAWALTLLMTAATVGLQFVPGAKFHQEIAGYSLALLLLLFLARRSFERSSLATGTLFALIGVLLTMGFGVLGSYALGKQFAPPITDFSAALYYTVVTMSTVGYGDITPHSPDARLFTVALIVFGLVVFATSLTAIAGPLINQRMMSLLQPKAKSMKRKNHIIVVGDNPLARNAINALRQRGVQVTAVWPQRPPEGMDEPDDLVIGDGSDVEVLRNADVQDARAVLALDEDDSDNAFVALAAKDANANVRTVVAVSDAHNMNRVRHVRPDAVLALPVIGGELLAMALSGEEIKTDALLEQLLKLG
jgi:voltage-gated potassium channel